MSKKIYIAGHTGMVGSAITRRYQESDYEIITKDLSELDLRKQAEVDEYVAEIKPDQMIIAAAKVGGILANNIYRAEFIYDNLMIASNLIHAAHENNVEKVLFLGSSCIYPKFADQPMSEEALLTGELEQTNEPYAIAKIAGIKLCENYYRQYDSNFFSVMPTNLYGPYDNFNLKSSHVLPALIRKAHEAKLNGTKELVVWGTGSPKREFLYVEDLANAIYYLMDTVNAKDIYEKGITHLNIGTGEDITIKELAETIMSVVGFEGKLTFDSTKPDGTPRKLMNVSRLNSLGWKHTESLKSGIEKTYNWFTENLNSDRIRL